MMRHMMIRGILVVIWLAAALVSGLAGNASTAVLYIILAGVFLYSAYTAWHSHRKNSQNDGK